MLDNGYYCVFRIVRLVLDRQLDEHGLIFFKGTFLENRALLEKLIVSVSSWPVTSPLLQHPDSFLQPRNELYCVESLHDK